MVDMTKDPRRAKQFYRKSEAVVAAKAIGWRVSDAVEIDVMGFRLYAIGDDHGNFLTESGFVALQGGR